MNVEKYKNVKIYPIEYLINEELSEDDLYNILDTKSLEYSLHCFMMRLINPDFTIKQCIDIASTNGWFDTYRWTHAQCTYAESQIEKAFMNIYQIGPLQARQRAQMYIVTYGPSIIHNKFLSTNK
jgi:hypothetical protein